MTGALLEFLNAMTSDDDDDKMKFYDKISDFDKSKNLIFMLPGTGGKSIKIPLPYGYNVFFAVGRAMAEGARGKDPAKIMGALGVTALDSFNPIGGSGSLLNMIAPTVIDPFVDLSRNRDFADRPIMPDEKKFGAKGPDSQRYWGSVSPIWKAITDTLNSATGGDTIKPGKIDVSPETMEYLWGVATGASGMFLSRFGSSVWKLFDPTSDLSWNDAPFARKLVGSAPSWQNKAMAYERMGEIEQEKSYVTKYAGAGRTEEAKAEYAQHKALLSMAGAAEATRQSLSDVSKARGAAVKARDLGRITDAQYAERINTLKATESAVVMRFNRLYNEKVLPGDR